MAIYAIGDLQGCLAPFQRLLDKLDFDDRRDQLWLVGDLVNRGPDSLATLRYVYRMGNAATCVLGNHDLHLLALHAGVSDGKDNAGLRAVLNAPDAEELLTWLRHRPLMHFDEDLNCAMVHAGLSPHWQIRQALELAGEVEAVLRSPGHSDFFAEMYGNQPDCWHDKLSGTDRLRVIVNFFTRLRYCDQEGRMNFSEKGPPGSQPASLQPWYEIPWSAFSGPRIVFGHWSALGARHLGRITALDAGCVWGRQLAATRIDGETQEIVTVPCIRNETHADMHTEDA